MACRLHFAFLSPAGERHAADVLSCTTPVKEPAAAHEGAKKLLHPVDVCWVERTRPFSTFAAFLRSCLINLSNVRVSQVPSVEERKRSHTTSGRSTATEVGSSNLRLNQPTKEPKERRGATAARCRAKEQRAPPAHGLCLGSSTSDGATTSKMACVSHVSHAP